MSELKMASGAEGKGGSFQKEGEEPEPLSGAESERHHPPQSRGPPPWDQGPHIRSAASWKYLHSTQEVLFNTTMH